MGRWFGFLLGAIIGSLTVSGCSRVETYTVQEERVDQNLASGNQGYLMGTPKEDPSLANRRPTRTRYVTEVEVGGPYKRRKSSEAPRVTSEMIDEPGTEEPIMEEEAGAVVRETGEGLVTRYTVAANDTLEKISQKVYGSPAKWKKIYDANADKLKSPDRIYPGQVLAIPQD